MQQKWEWNILDQDINMESVEEGILSICCWTIAFSLQSIYFYYKIRSQTYIYGHDNYYHA